MITEQKQNINTINLEHSNKVFDMIENIEKDKRVAITKKFPLLLYPILETKRLIRKSKTKLNPKFRLSSENNNSSNLEYDITLHSSPLYRKYNSEELDKGKIQNIKLAISKLDGLVIYPGKVFSFWNEVGRTDEASGYSKGLVLSDGRLKEDYGGGLCQLSNLLAYMFACTECEFVERKHHSRDVFPDSGRNVPFASGATVFYNLIDLKVKNTYDHPIVLHLRTTDTQLRGSISCPLIKNYKIKLEERDANFYKSKITGLTYRYNKLFRVYYEKVSKNKIKETLLWENLARVMYDESQIKSGIITN